MKYISKAILMAAVCVFASGAVFAQTSTFSDPSVEYTFEIPDERWKLTVRPSDSNTSPEFVFVDRNDGYFTIRKTTASPDTPLSDVIREEEQKLQFMRGYVAGREENFRGKLSGTIFNFEFVERGRPKSGRFYFLRSGSTVYILRFTGYRDKLRSIQHFTDSIARTFSVS